jgi:hypothetical protein
MFEYTNVPVDNNAGLSIFCNPSQFQNSVSVETSVPVKPASEKAVYSSLFPLNLRLRFHPLTF